MTVSRDICGMEFQAQLVEDGAEHTEPVSFRGDKVIKPVIGSFRGVSRGRLHGWIIIRLYRDIKGAG